MSCGSPRGTGCHGVLTQCSTVSCAGITVSQQQGMIPQWPWPAKAGVGDYRETAPCPRSFAQLSFVSARWFRGCLCPPCPSSIPFHYLISLINLISFNFIFCFSKSRMIFHDFITLMTVSLPSEDSANMFLPALFQVNKSNEAPLDISTSWPLHHGGGLVKPACCNQSFFYQEKVHIFRMGYSGVETHTCMVPTAVPIL